MSLVPYLQQFVDQLYQAYEAGDERLWLSTSFHHLDYLLHGLKPGTITVLASDASMGKSALARNIMLDIATRALPVMFAAPDTNPVQLATTLTCLAARIAPIEVANLCMDDDAWKRMMSATEVLRDIPIDLFCKAGMTTDDVGKAAQGLRERTGGPALLIVDDIHAVHPRQGQFYQDNQRIDAACRELKTLACALDIPVLILATLTSSRKQEYKSPNRNYRPLVADVQRTASGLWDYSDAVVLLYRDECFNPETPDKGITEVIVAKNKTGPVGTIRLVFDEHTMRFDNFIVEHAAQV